MAFVRLFGLLSGPDKAWFTFPVKRISVEGGAQTKLQMPPVALVANQKRDVAVVGEIARHATEDELAQAGMAIGT